MTTFRLRQRTYPDHVLTVYSSMAHVTWKSSGPMCGGVGRILRPDLCMSVSSWPQVPLLGLSSVYPDRQELGGGIKTAGGSMTERRDQRLYRPSPRRWRRRGGREKGRGYPPPQPTKGSGGAPWAPQRGPRKRIWCTLELSKSHWWQSFWVFWSACFTLHTGSTTTTLINMTKSANKKWKTVWVSKQHLKFILINGKNFEV